MTLVLTVGDERPGDIRSGDIMPLYRYFTKCNFTNKFYI
jgi:hypothetical protein